MTSVAEKQRAHELLDLLPAGQVTEALRYLESPTDAEPGQYPLEDEEISEEEEAAAAASREWFKHNEGIPFEQVVAELGFTMDEVRRGSKDPPD